MIIYKAVNKINGKIYIGKTIYPLDSRLRRHLRADLPFSKALKKYGLTSFTIEIIDYADSPDILSDKEKYWIKYYGSKGKNGYNMTDGGDGIPGWNHSEETRKKISNAHIGTIVSEEIRKILSDAHKGVPLSESHRRNIGIAHKGHKHTLASKIKMSVARKGIGWPMSEETKQKISIANKGKVRSEDAKLKYSIAKKGIKLRPRTEEHSAKISAGVKRNWQLRKQEVMQNVT